MIRYAITGGVHQPFRKGDRGNRQCGPSSDGPDPSSRWPSPTQDLQNPRDLNPRDLNPGDQNPQGQDPGHPDQQGQDPRGPAPGHRHAHPDGSFLDVFHPPFASCAPAPTAGTGFLPFPPSTALLDQARALARQGVDYLQLREKHLTSAELAQLARQVLAVLAETPSPSGHTTRLLINHRADVAAATRAHGVHLPGTPGTLHASQVRLLFRSLALSAPIISQSCHSLAEVRAARADPPDLILFSPVFGKFTDGILVGTATGLQALHAACAEAHPIPVLALGGVTEANIPQCQAAGAAGIAAIRFFLPG